MEKFVLRFVVLLTPLWLLSLTSCSGGSADPVVVSGIDSNILISGNFSQNDSDKIEGSGTVRFTNTLLNSSSRSFSLKASLDSTIALSEISVVFYSSDASIPSTNGLAVTFTRSGASVNGKVSFNGNPATIAASKMTFYFPSALDVIIDFHNVNNKARVLIWRRNMVEYAAATADVDTDRSGDLVETLPQQKGGGTFVGLILQNATVTTARVDSQKVLN